MRPLLATALPLLLAGCAVGPAVAWVEPIGPGWRHPPPRHGHTPPPPPRHFVPPPPRGHVSPPGYGWRHGPPPPVQDTWRRGSGRWGWMER